MKLFVKAQQEDQTFEKKTAERICNKAQKMKIKLFGRLQQDSCYNIECNIMFVTKIARRPVESHTEKTKKKDCSKTRVGSGRTQHGVCCKGTVSRLYCFHTKINCSKVKTRLMWQSTEHNIRLVTKTQQFTQRVRWQPGRLIFQFIIQSTRCMPRIFLSAIAHHIFLSIDATMCIVH